MRNHKLAKNLGLLLINLVPLYGVISLGWDALAIILLYVAETILVGLIHVVKMTALYLMNHKNPEALAVVRPANSSTGWWVIPFFMFHFFFFVLIQMLVFNGFTKGPGLFESIGKLFIGNYKYALITIFITKLTLMMNELLTDMEISKKLPIDVMFEPYPRIFVQQFMVVLGGWMSIVNPNIMGYLIVLIIMKTGLDILLANISFESLKKYSVEG